MMSLMAAAQQVAPPVSSSNFKENSLSDNSGLNLTNKLNNQSSNNNKHSNEVVAASAKMNNLAAAVVTANSAVSKQCKSSHSIDAILGLRAAAAAAVQFQAAQQAAQQAAEQCFSINQGGK